MKIHFNIPYHTYWGQRLMISANIPELGNNDIQKAMSLNFHGDGNWTAEVEIATSECIQFNYKYLIFTEQTGKYIQEWGDDREMTLNPSKIDHCFLYDTWNSPASVENVFFTSPFQKVLLPTKKFQSNIAPLKKYTHTFRVKAPHLDSSDVLCLVGNCEALGNWSTNAPLLMEKNDDNF